MTDIHQSPGDRLRFEIILKFLVEGGANLAVLSEDELVLDFYAKLIEERLRRAGQHQVEFCFSTNSEKLVQKFNDILSDLTVDQALNKDTLHAPRRYLVFRDSILMQDFELQLLARLVNGFPAGNIRVILLIHGSGGNRNKLETFGKNLLQWEVETLSGASPAYHTDLGDNPPPIDNVPVLTEVVDATVKVEPLTAEPIASTPLAVDPVVPEPPLAPPSFQRPAPQMPWRWIVLSVLVMGAGWGVLHQDLLMNRVTALGRSPLPGAATPASAPQETEAGQPAASQAASAASDVASAASAAMGVASQTAEAPSDDAWVHALTEAGYVVQLAAFDAEADMQTFQRSTALYAKARILRARKKDSGQRYFILVAGPFDSRADADAYMQSSPLLAKGWLRTVKSLKSQFPSA